MSYGFLSAPAPGILADSVIEASKSHIAESDGRVLAWGWYPYGIAMLNLWQVTSDPAYLSQFAAQYRRILGARDSERDRLDSLHGRVLHAWGFPDDETGWRTSIAVSGRIAHAGLRFALLAPPIFAVDAEWFAEAGKTTIDEFDGLYRQWRHTGYYHDPFRARAEALNHTHALAQAIVAAHHLFHGYRGRLRRLVAWFRHAAWEQGDGSWAWPYRPEPQIGRPKREQPEWSWKGQLTAQFLLDAHLARTGVRRREVAAIAKTFLYHVDTPCGLNQTIARDHFASLDECSNNYRSGAVKWAPFDRVDRRVGDRTIELVDTRRDYFPDGWLTNGATLHALSELLVTRPHR